MIDQTPPEIMSTEDRLKEVANILAGAGDRLKDKARSKKKSLRAYIIRPSDKLGIIAK
jgi:hypothetical protein